ncbi:N-acetylneuraminate lyase-like isoform X2 [Panulirus ornatus]|uniref:N-acetylneuraminate lyase-like isoform X2 n=1 Tax=Panulirus ornatus TaxID=150431 RepID=UPI003A83E319
MARLPFRGMMAATFTPFKADGSLKLDVIPTYANYLREKGVKGIWVCGTAGEGMSLTMAERKAQTEAWLKHKDDISTIIIQCGAGSLKDTQELASHAEKAGANGVSVLPNLFDKPKSTEELVEYMAEVAKACPKTPLFYYHIPMKTDVRLSMSEFLTKGVARIPTLSGLKFTDHDVRGEGYKCLQVDNGSLTILNGFDETLQEAIGLGFTSAVNVGFNLFPHLGAQMFSLMEAKNEAEAIKIQEQVVRYLEAIFKQTGGFSVSSVKTAGSLLTGLDFGPTRLPNKPFKDSMIDALRNDLKNLSLQVY